MQHETQRSTDTSRWALVTGASSGIGKEFATQLASQGYHLVLVARRADKLHSLASDLREAFGTASLVIPADLAEKGAADKVARQLEDREITVEFLVNNAGYGVPGRFTDPDWTAHEAFIQVMMTAVCELTWRLLPSMQQNRRGYIVNVASLAGLTSGSEGHTLYGASKSFVIRFSESLALESRWHGINVSALCPGFTYSEFHDVTGTRDLVSRLPGFMWQTAGEVVSFGIESVRKDPPRTVAVPGRVNRLLARLNRYVPGLGRLLVKRMSKRFRKLD
jgi:short-subunit dehydrogenase